jgi:hypothetical protein
MLARLTHDISRNLPGSELSPGVNEIIGWTDCDESVSAGVLVKGTSWQRPNDVVGVADFVGGLSSEARAYFAAGRARHFDRRRRAQLPDGEGLRNLLLLQPEQLVECHVRLSTHCGARLQRRPRADPRFSVRLHTQFLTATPRIAPRDIVVAKRPLFPAIGARGCRNYLW